MLSARAWKAKRLWFHTAIFWLWLGAFTFTAGLSDQFHSAQCQEQAMLFGAGRNQQYERLQAPGAVLAGHADCAACAYQTVALATLPVGPPDVQCLSTSASHQDPLPTGDLPRSSSPLARGPPAIAL